MMEKAYSLFLCVLLILVLFLPSTAAGRALLQTEGEGGYHGGNGASRIGIHGHPSSPAPSRTGVSSPSGPTPVGKGVTECTKNRYAACTPSEPKSCGPYQRNCR
ncbi:uncharacterized protein LOC117923650 [Vitis riparia]|uniref:uncharacterized protein LOC117923650 n=1 Tax=Vitis riparia TaxID=96939 RepID=UPI00155AC8AA|nr:uncharacterized protein LOC117923650 [Vitis riparia]